MATARFSIKQGDTLPVLNVSLVSEQGTPYTLSVSAVVTLNYKHKETGETFIRPMTVVNATNGDVRYTWTLGDTDVAGDYNAEVQVVDNGKTWTYPGGGRYFTLSIPQQLDVTGYVPPDVGTPAPTDMLELYRSGAKFKATANSLDMRKALGLADNAGLLPADMLPAPTGENFILVLLTSDPLQNGQNLKNACTQAATMLPNGMAQSPSSYGNRVQILLLPGRYDLGTTDYLTLPAGVDLVGLASDPSQVWICSNATADNYVLLKLNGYNRVAGVTLYLNAAGVTSNAATTDRHAAVMGAATAVSSMFFFNCLLFGSNTLTPANMGSGYRFDHCSIPQGFRYVTLNSFFFIDCWGYTTQGGQFNNHKFDCVGCRFTAFTTFVRCYVLVADHQPTAGGRFIACPYVAYSMSSTFTGNMYVYANHADCGEVVFLVSSGVTTTGRFLLNGTFRNCRFTELTHLTIQSPRFLDCSIAEYSNNTFCSPVVYNTGAIAVFIGCSFIKTPGQTSMLFNPVAAGGSIALERCSLSEGFTVGANLTLLSGSTLAEAFNYVMPTGSTYSRVFLA